jgi:CubicO group peptidase (beta-lactamase class C family)
VHDTAAVIFSCTKGLLAICAYFLVQEGRLDLDAPIASYWPRFAAHGKATITVRDAMSHRAGLAALDVDLTRDEVLAWEPVIRAIEAQPPLHRSDAGHLYHAHTYGWILGEVIRRVTGLKPGQFFASVLGEPMGLRTWIGLPAEARPSLAWMEVPLPDEDSDAAQEASMLAAAEPTVARSLSMGGAFGFPVEAGVVSFNDPGDPGGRGPRRERRQQRRVVGPRLRLVRRSRLRWPLALRVEHRRRTHPSVERSTALRTARRRRPMGYRVPARISANAANARAAKLWSCRRRRATRFRGC